ncbi:MAG: hypothetical protein WBG43_13140 [Marinifilaceae bacterium]
MTTKQAKISLIALLMFCIAVIIGALSFEDEQLAQARYCERIANGMPAYNERINCGNVNK